MSSITAQIAPWIDSALAEHDEPVLWEGQLMPVPPAPGEQPEPRYVVFVWFPGHLVDTTLNGSFMLENPLTVTEAGIKETITNMLRALREARSQMVAAEAPPDVSQPVSAPIRGSQTPSGLYIG